MSKIVLTIFILLFNGISFCFAQKNSLETILKENLPFSEKQKLARDYFRCEMEDSVFEAHGDKDDEYSEYKRWEWIAQKCKMPDGYIADPLIDYLIRKAIVDANKKRYNSTWQAIGQTNLNNTPAGIGRVDAIACHPADSNILYIGTYCGGIWKTMDGGNSWVALGDGLPLCSVGSICIDPLNPDVIYIVLGVNLANNAGLGIYKSTDAGLTWNPTGQTSTVAAQIVYKKLIIHPLNSNILFSCQSNGLWKTTDAGVTWSLINSFEFTNLMFNPLNPLSMYASGSGFGITPSQIFKSTDGGNTFFQLSNFTNENYLNFSITRADTNYIAVRSSSISAFHFYLSKDNGFTFDLQNGNNSIDNGGQVIISPTNKYRMYVGFPALYKSIDGGITWVYNSNNVHADTRAIAVGPLNNNLVYFCNDGGIYKLNDSTGTWTNLSNTLDITMFYDISLSQQDSVTLIGGSQDNGSRIKNSAGTWDVVTGGDGLITATNPLDDRTMFASTQHGAIYRTYDQWLTQSSITPLGISGAWKTPYLLGPSNPHTVYAGYHDVMKSFDQGTTWNTLSNLTAIPSTRKLEYLDVARTDSDYIYCSTMYYDELFYTANGGTSWTQFSAPASLTNYISALKIDPGNKNRIFILKDGYVNHDKILSTSDQGITWKNISYNLPNIPNFCLTINPGSDSTNMDFYIGTSIGVYYKKDLDTIWTYLGNGLPNTYVMDLEIRVNYNKLVAATFGHGIWQIDLPNTSGTTNIPNVQNKNEVNLLGNKINNELNFESTLSENNSFNFYLFDLYGKKVFEQHRSLSQGMNRFSILIPSLAPGNYFVKAESTKFNKVYKVIVSR